MRLARLACVDSNSDHMILYCWSRSSSHEGTRPSRSAEKIRLVSTLLSSIGIGHGFGRQVDSTDTVRIANDSLGRPELYVGARKGPAVSFSYAPQQIWGAACSDASGLGIDVADPSDFGEGYPFDRVFHEEELGLALQVCHGERKEAAALLWSAKESILKSLGCGLHLIDPLEVQISQVLDAKDGPQWHAQVTNDARSKVRPFDEKGLPVFVSRQGCNWVSLAAIFQPDAILGQVSVKDLGRV